MHNPILAPKKSVSEETQREVFAGRRQMLKDILKKKITLVHGEVVRDRIRHQIKNPQNNGHFVCFVCDHCYSDLYQEDPKSDVLSCPGCGWITTL